MVDSLLAFKVYYHQLLNVYAKYHQFNQLLL